MTDNIQRREHFRLQYPVQARPSLTVDGVEYPITEVSEEGGRLLASSIQPSAFNAGPQVTLNFHNDKRVVTIASFLRMDRGEIVLKFFPAIPQGIILSEQRWLLNRYSKEQLLASRGNL